MNPADKICIAGHRGLVGSALMRRLSTPSPSTGEDRGGGGSERKSEGQTASKDRPEDKEDYIPPSSTSASATTSPSANWPKPYNRLPATQATSSSTPPSPTAYPGSSWTSPACKPWLGQPPTNMNAGLAAAHHEFVERATGRENPMLSPDTTTQMATSRMACWCAYPASAATPRRPIAAGSLHPGHARRPQPEGQGKAGLLAGVNQA